MLPLACQPKLPRPYQPIQKSQWKALDILEDPVDTYEASSAGIADPRG